MFATGPHSPSVARTGSGCLIISIWVLGDIKTDEHQKRQEKKNQTGCRAWSNEVWWRCLQTADWRAEKWNELISLQCRDCATTERIQRFLSGCFSLSYILYTSSFSLHAWKRKRLVSMFWLKQTGLLVLAINVLSMKRKNGKDGSVVARSLHLTDSPKTWLCILYLPWPLCIS